MKTILVTGSAGFIGANLVLRLLKEGFQGEPCRIVGLDNLNDYYDVSLKEYRLHEIEKVASVIPGLSLVIPGLSLVIPGLSLVIPGLSLVIPGLSLVIPGLSLVIPGLTLNLSLRHLQHRRPARRRPHHLRRCLRPGARLRLHPEDHSSVMADEFDNKPIAFATY